MKLKRTVAALMVAGAVALPSAASASEAALLAAILKQNISQLAQQQLIHAINKAGFGNVVDMVQQASNQNAMAVINGGIAQHNQQVLMDQQASTFCQDDQSAPTKIGRSVTQRTYAAQTGLFNKFNHPEAVKDPSKFTAKVNQELKDNISNTCDPRVLPPVGKKDVAANSDSGLRCTPKQIEVAVGTATGRQISPELPPALQKTNIGEALRKEIDTYNSRLSAAEAGIQAPMSEERDIEIAAYQKLFVSPTIAQINEMSGKGGVGRDALVMMQIQSQMMLAMYKETIEMRRLMAILVAQGQDDHKRRINEMAAAASTGGRR